MDRFKIKFLKALENQYFEAFLWVLGGVLLCTLTAYFFGVEDRPSNGGRGISPGFAFLIGVLCVLWGGLKAFLRALEIKKDS